MLGMDWGLVPPPFFQRNEYLPRGVSYACPLQVNSQPAPTNPSLNVEKCSAVPEPTDQSSFIIRLLICLSFPVRQNG